MDHKEHNGMKDSDHPSHHRHMMLDFRKRFLISLSATVPVLILSPMIQSWTGLRILFTGDSYVLFAFASLIYIYGGWPFLKGLADELSDKRPGMMTLIGLAISVAYAYSSLVVFGLMGKVFFWELVTLVDIMLLGHWIEMRSVMGASGALEELVKMLPSEAHRLREDGSQEDIRVEELEKGDRIIVKPGEQVPVDGKVTDGSSEVDESALTGESRPVSKEAGNEVIGGSINGTGDLTLSVTGAGGESYLSKVVDMVRSASESRSRAQTLADRAAFWLTIVAVTAGLATLISWLLFGKEFVFALERMVTVMVITCPHALGLAVPLVIAVITSLAARNGLLVRERAAFESARLIDTVVFDKTGTLTTGRFHVTDIVPLDGSSEKSVLAAAAAVESGSEHTLGAGIIRKADEEGVKISSSSEFEAVPGKGARGTVDGREVYVGNARLLEMLDLEPGESSDMIDGLAREGKTAVVVAAESGILGIIALADTVRDEAVEAVKTLQDKGIEVTMITGDNRSTAEAVAEELGIDTWFAEVLPDGKSEKIEELQSEGKKVGMVGDGVNDAPALAQADIGIAIGAGTDVAVETADVVLVKNDPRAVIDVIALSRATRRKTIQNLLWASGYNIIAIPLAAGVLYHKGIVLAPAVGAMVMSLSTVIVAANAKLVSYKGSHKSSAQDDSSRKAR
jgi:Cu2+-exporting ATPase